MEKGYSFQKEFAETTEYSCRQIKIKIIFRYKITTWIIDINLKNMKKLRKEKIFTIF